MNGQELDPDSLDSLFGDFDGVTVEGGVDSKDDGDCEGGIYKIRTSGRLKTSEQAI